MNMAIPIIMERKITTFMTMTCKHYQIGPHLKRFNRKRVESSVSGIMRGWGRRVDLAVERTYTVPVFERIGNESTLKGAIITIISRQRRGLAKCSVQQSTIRSESSSE